MKVALLMANTDESAFAARWPGDGEKFSSLLGALRPGWQFTVFSVKDGRFPDSPAGFDAFLITGSPASVHDDDPWIARLGRLIREIVDLGRPLFGACFGHQAIATALGGAVARNPGGWVLGLAHTQMEGVPLRLYAAHNEQVTRLPPQAVSLGGNDDCPIGAFAIGSAVLTTQYHPEMTAPFIGALVEELAPVLPAPVIDRARRSLTEPAETEWMARRIVRFLEGG